MTERTSQHTPGYGRLRARSAESDVLRAPTRERVVSLPGAARSSVALERTAGVGTCSYVQALWRGVERDRSEDSDPLLSSHPFFGRLCYYDNSDRNGHWEAGLSHPRTAERYTVCIPGGPDTPLQPFANAYRKLVGSPDALLMRCKAAMREEYALSERIDLDELRGLAFVLEGITLPGEAREDGSWRAHYRVEPSGRRLTVRFESTLVRKVVLDD